MNEYTGGALLSPKDKRDYTVTMAMDIAPVEIPETFSVWQPPTENQGNTGNCVAQTVANVMECIRHRAEDIHKDMSVGFVYGNRKEGQAMKRGMRPREALANLLVDGDIQRSVWDSSSEVPEIIAEFKAIFDRVKDQAYRPKAYVRLNTPDEAKLFMLKYNLPVLAVGETANLIGWGNGYHAVTLCAWNTKAIFHNSWGNYYEWHETEWTNFDEMWGIVPMENNFTDIEGRWSEAAILEAALDGIIEGFPDNSFRPQEPLTREQIAVIWQRMKIAIKKMMI